MSIKPAGKSSSTGEVAVDSFGSLDNGTEVTRYTLENGQSTRVAIIDLGATITSLHTRDKHGEMSDIVLGFDNPRQYLTDSPYFGAVVGRYANRIARGRFALDGKTYQLAANNGDNHLHGGDKGFDKRLWRGEIVGPNTVAFHLDSPDGEEGYPGRLEVTVTYTLGEDNSLIINYRANTDAPTVLNLSQHSYFNLAGHASGTHLEQQLQINADFITPVDAGLIPTGERLPVAGTPFDFRISKAIGKDINADHEQLRFGEGFDHNWVLSDTAAAADIPAARAWDPASGRTLTVYTDQPGIQFYAGNFLDGSIRGKDGAPYQHRNGFCLETQHFPDSPNHPDFPSTRLDPGQTFESTTRFVFGVSP